MLIILVLDKADKHTCFILEIEESAFLFHADLFLLFFS